jgi:hypothetical protein
MVTFSGDRVQFDVSREDFDLILMALGMGAGGAPQPFFWRIVRLVNTINEGNPNFTPYEIPDKWGVNKKENSNG